MRKDYYEVYSDLYDIYRGPFPGLDVTRPSRMWLRDFSRFDVRDLRMIDEAITDAQLELGLRDRLRPDAKFFLLINIHQMIFLPVAFRSPERPVDIKDSIREDVRTILEASKDEAIDGEVSGHMLIDGLSRVWSKLKTTSSNVWG